MYNTKFLQLLLDSIFFLPQYPEYFLLNYHPPNTGDTDFGESTARTHSSVEG